MSDSQLTAQAPPLPFPLDPAQRRVLDAPPRQPLVVIGAAGSGKTSTLVELLAHRLDSGAFAPEQVLALAPGRAQAARLRERLDRRLGGTVTGPRARTPQSLAFELVRDDRGRTGRPAPVLLTGADDDALVRELLAAEHDWPQPIGPQVLALAAFRSELRELLAVMSEYDIEPEELAGLAGHWPAWRPAAQLAEERRTVLAWQREGAVDVPGLLLEAASALHRRAAGSRAGAFAELRLVAVDDAQELTEAGRRLLAGLEAFGVTVITFGDPDLATSVFRGGAAEHAAGWRGRREQAAERLLLDQVHRHGPPLREAVRAITGRLGVRGEGRQRAALAAADAPKTPGGPVPAIATATAASPVAEAALVAAVLRRLHLEHGVPWHEMAVLSRSGGALPTLARLLRRHEVPADASRPPAAADDPAVAALVRIAAIAAGVEQLGAAAIEQLLVSPLFAVDTLRLRQLRRSLRLAELQSGGRRSTAELLLVAVTERTAPALPERHPARLALHRLTELLERAREQVADAAADEVLWGIWAGSGVADRWRDTAVQHDPAAGAAEARRQSRAADERLDAVVTLFDIAKRFVERTPKATTAGFVAFWNDRDVAADTLAARPQRDAVTLATPASVVGREFEAVVVTGLTEGVWPNLRQRDTLLGAGRLVELISEGEPEPTRDRRRQVLDDETRMFAQAVSRARRWLLVTAIDGEDAQPSTLFRSFAAPRIDPELVELPRTLRGLSGALRRRARAAALAGGTPQAEVAALARLAAAGAPGAHPDSWLGLREPSSTRPIAMPDEASLRLSPSGVEDFEDCGVNWFVTHHGGGTTSAEMTLGTLVHASAEYAFATPAARRDYLESRLSELQAESPWRGVVLQRRLAAMVTALEDYLDEQRSQRVQLLAAERPLELELPLSEAGFAGTVRVSGTIDRVELAADGTVAIVDFKTGRSVPSVAAAARNAQLASYQFAYLAQAIGSARQQDPDPPAAPVDSGAPVTAAAPLAGARLVYLAAGGSGRSAVREQPPLGPDLQDELRQRLLRAALGMTGLIDQTQQWPDADSPARFLADPRGHCLASFGAGRACRIHIIGEISE